jgi:branched-chain amino acid transport system ATP-binding protein
MTAIIRAEKVDAGYGRHPVVRGLDLEVHPGEVVAVLGPNGAGKTTTLLTLSGSLPPLGGSLYWEEKSSALPLHRRARLGQSFVTEERSVFMSLTASENLRVGRCDVEAALALFPELKGLLKVKAGSLSGGEQQMLTLARALARHPRLVIADELSLGLAPLVVHRLFGAVRAAADTGVAVLLVEQHVRKVLEIADRAYVMRRGRVELAGSAAEVSRRLDEVEGSYLTDLEL